MSERKYRQRGYQDDGRDRPEGAGRPPGPERPRAPRPPGKPAGSKIGREPRAANVPSFQQAMRCARCGTEFNAAFEATATCSRCGTALHSCVQCSFFDPGSRFECMQTIAARIAPKDAANTCAAFEPRVQVERQTTSTRVGPTSAKDAFDKLFKL